MKLFKPFLAAFLFVVMGFAKAEMIIDFGDSSGFGTAKDFVQINNIRVDTRTKIVNPFAPEEIQFEVITMYYDVPFRFDLAGMHLVPDMSGAATQTAERNCAQLTVFVTNAMNGSPIGNAIVTVGGISKSTDVSGNALFDKLPTGPISVQVTYPDFVIDSKTANLACGNNGTVSLSLSPSVGEDALLANDLRLILTWGEQPVDLDAHLTGPCPGLSAVFINEDVGFINEENRFHVYWPPDLRSGCDGMVNLDVDDMSSFGPETITIVPNPATGRLNEGIYRYTVYQYQGSGTLADSASVSLLVGNYPPRTFYPPLLCQGNLIPSLDNVTEAVELGNIWKVLELHVNAAGIVSVVEVNTCGQEAGSAVVRSKTIR